MRGSGPVGARAAAIAALLLAGCGGGDGGGGTDAGMDGGDGDAGAFDVAAHLIAAEEAVAEEISVRVRCGAWGCDEPDGGDFFDIEAVAEFTAPTEGDYVADWGEIFYFIFASADGFYTQFLPSVDEGATYTLDLDRIPDYPSAVAGVIFATQNSYAPSPVAGQPIHATGPGGLEFDFATDALGRYGLHDLPAGSYVLQFDFEEEVFGFQISSGDGLAYEDLYFENPWQDD